MRYEKDGKGYLSVTQLISIFYPFNKDSYVKWCEANGHDHEKITRDSTLMGTKVSEWIENSTLGMQELDSPAQTIREKGLKRAVDKFLKENEVYEAEKTVYCEEFRYAGTLDMIANVGGKDGLWDAKTYGSWQGRYELGELKFQYKESADKMKKVRIQDSMYLYALERLDLPMGVVIFLPTGNYIVKELTYSDRWKDLMEKNKNKINSIFEKNDTIRHN